MCWGLLVPGWSLRSPAQATYLSAYPSSSASPPMPLSLSWCRGALRSARCKGPGSGPRLCRDRNIEDRTGSEGTSGPLQPSGQQRGLPARRPGAPGPRPPRSKAAAAWAPGATAHARPAGRCLGGSQSPSVPVPPGHCPLFPTPPTASALRWGAGPSPPPPGRHLTVWRPRISRLSSLSHLSTEDEDALASGLAVPSPGCNH